MVFSITLQIFNKENRLFFHFNKRMLFGLSITIMGKSFGFSRYMFGNSKHWRFQVLSKVFISRNV